MALFGSAPSLDEHRSFRSLCLVLATDRCALQDRVISGSISVSTLVSSCPSTKYQDDVRSESRWIKTSLFEAVKAHFHSVVVSS